jgi:hypothetical protein
MLPLALEATPNPLLSMDVSRTPDREPKRSTYTQRSGVVWIRLRGLDQDNVISAHHKQNVLQLLD